MAADPQGSPLLGYRIYWNNGSGAANQLLVEDLDVTTEFSTSPTVSDLNDGAEYRFKILAFNAVGDGLISE